MTVAELIAKLQELPQEMLVLGYEGEQYGYDHIGDAHVRPVFKDRKGYYHIGSLEKSFEAVVLFGK